MEIELSPGVDGQADVARRVADALRESLGLTVPLRVVETNTLPQVRAESETLRRRELGIRDWGLGIGD